jgi:hypothetical protein
LPQTGNISAGGVDYHLQQPHSYQGNFSVEQALPWTMALSVTYAFNRGVDLYRRTEGNPARPLGTPTIVNGTNFCANTGATTFNPSGLHCWLGTETRLNTAWGTANRLVADSSSWYNGLQIGLRKRMTRGLQFQGNYTWSKVIDETQGIIDAENTASHFAGADPWNRRADRAPSSFDLRHNFSFNAVYALPQVSSAGGVVDWLRATRAQAGFGELHVADRGLPDRVQGGGGAGGDTLQFRGIKPDAATSPVTDVEGHVAGAFFAQRIFTGWTFHRLIWFAQVLPDSAKEMKNFFSVL